MKTISRLWVIVLITLSFTMGASAATFTVNNTQDTLDTTPGDGTCADANTNCTLRAAIGEANALAGADIITLPGGLFAQGLVAANEDANAGGDWDINGDLTINGAGNSGAGASLVVANLSPGVASERVLNIRSGTVVITGVVIGNGRFTGTMTAATRGANIENLGSLTLNNCSVSNGQINSTNGNSIGAGIHNAGPSLTLNNVNVFRNINTRAAGGSAFGGGLSSIVAATITITNSDFTENEANGTPGIQSFGFGAGMYLENAFNVTITGSNFDDNIGRGANGAQPGGSNGTGVRALSNAPGAVFNATDTTFSDNSGTGGSSNQGALQFFTVTATANTLTANLNRVTINGNTGNGSGVGLSATRNGGALTVNVNNSTISNNTGGLNGGGVAISNINATLAAAMVFNFTNSTISGNSSTGSGGGFAMEQPATGTVTTNFNFTTIARNTGNSDNTGAGESGGGIALTGGTLNLKNSIVGDNSVGTGATAPDISGAIVSGDYNHFENITGATITGTTANNVTGTDPDIGALALNGGTTRNHLPNASSPVLNTIPNGTNDCGTTITTDQRSVTRPDGAGCEKGSVERNIIAPGPWDLSGTIKSASGMPIRNVAVTVTGGSLPPGGITVYTGMFGTYQFLDLPGASYTVTVQAKKFTFGSPSQVVSLGADNSTVDFTANEEVGVRPPPLVKDMEE